MPVQSLAYANCRQNGTTGGNVLCHEVLECFNDATDGVWRLKTEAVGELPIRRRTPGLRLIYECLAKTFFQHDTRQLFHASGRFSVGERSDSEHRSGRFG